MSEIEWLVKKLKAAEDAAVELIKNSESYCKWWSDELAMSRKLRDEIAELEAKIAELKKDLKDNEANIAEVTGLRERNSILSECVADLEIENDRLVRANS